MAKRDISQTSAITITSVNDIRDAWNTLDTNNCKQYTKNVKHNSEWAAFKKKKGYTKLLDINSEKADGFHTE